MKKDKIKGRAKNVAAYSLGAFTSVLATNLVTANLGKPKVENAPTQNEMRVKAGIHGFLGLASGIGLVFIEGDDFLSNTLKGLCATGVGLNSMGVITSLAQSSSTVKEKLMKQGTIQKVVRDAIGLKCPCNRNIPQRMNQYQLNRPKRRGMRAPFHPESSYGEMKKVIVI